MPTEMGTKVRFENEEYAGTSLTDAEIELLENQLRNYMAPKGSFFEQLILDNWGKIIGAAEVAKDKFKATFKGVGASDSEIALQKIRPGHILRTTGATEAPQNDWLFTFTADSDNWVGYGAANGTAINIDRELLLLCLGVVFTQPQQPVVEEIRVTVGNTVYPVEVIRDAFTADNKWRIRGTPLRPKLLVPKATTFWEVYSIAAGQNELVILGLAFGLGRLLRLREPSTVSV